jgi:predicted Ser/Thr protein kinase
MGFLKNLFKKWWTKEKPKKVTVQELIEDTKDILTETQKKKEDEENKKFEEYINSLIKRGMQEKGLTEGVARRWA